ncbi:hypothetical protein [Arcanobacterium pinnipediorum]|uniref:Uncharacterized protein n=1 Tax=Arcanobacterium pinnipediorum TaxID=1503041 RepID=A0ABY5AJD2_9ACTO|nr:hypothetical protein [Arcanobacterium pinnipediorum]USR79298.1 hypothetical protein NG665_07965 [Arcanobacterium pinnipediorum]
MTTTEPTQPVEELRALLPDNLDEYSYDVNTHCPDGHAFASFGYKNYGLLSIGYWAIATKNGGRLEEPEVLLESATGFTANELLELARNATKAAMFLKATTANTAGARA